MNEVTEMYAAWAEEKRAKRAANKASSTELLRKAGLSFVSHNNGVHLVITHRGATCNFWPSTGLWRTVSGVKGRGVKNLLKHYGVKYEVQEPAV